MDERNNELPAGLQHRIAADARVQVELPQLAPVIDKLDGVLDKVNLLLEALTGLAHQQQFPLRPPGGDV